MPEDRGQLELSFTVGGWSFSAPGPTEVVLDVYADFKKFSKAGPAIAPTGAPAAPPAPVAPTDGGGVADTPGVQVEVKAPTNLPLKPYLARLDLKGNKEKATAVVAWSAESGDKPALTVSEIEQLWKKTPFKAPSNLARDVRKAESEGWLDAHGKPGSPDTTYSINGYGEGIVAGWESSGKE
jgi:hypothetical protein